MRLTVTTAPLLAGLGIALLAACGPAATGPAPSDGSATTAAARSDWCADPAVAAEVDAALASTTESVHNSILVTPEEMKELGGHTDAEIEGQLAAWEKLTPADVDFQQCLRVRQGQPAIDPVPGATSGP